MLGYPRLLEWMVMQWVNDIKTSQLPSILGGVGPMHSFIQLCESAALYIAHVICDNYCHVLHVQCILHTLYVIIIVMYYMYNIYCTRYM